MEALKRISFAVIAAMIVVLFVPRARAADPVSVNAAGTAMANNYSTVDYYQCAVICGEVQSSRHRISADGRYVVFDSNASDIDPLDTNSGNDVYVRDTATGATRLVSVNATGNGPGNSSSYDPSISADGTHVVFNSWATNLTSLPVYSNPQVYVRDLVNNTTQLVSVRSDGTTAGNSSSYGAAISNDGLTVAFNSPASDLTANPSACGSNYWQVYARDLVNNVTDLVSGNGSGQRPCASSGDMVISADGRYVAFSSGATDIVTPSTGYWKVFRRDRQASVTALASVTTAGDGQVNCDSYNASISADGNRIAFHSCASNLHALDTNGNWDVFVRDFTAPTTYLGSINAAGTAGANNWSQVPILSSDGSVVAFRSSASDLVSTPTGGLQNIFARRIDDATTTLVTESYDGAEGANSSNNQGVSISSDGRYVAFMSYATNLGWAADRSNWDIFVRDTVGGLTHTSSTRPDHRTTGSSDSIQPFLSNDGSRVAFMSVAPDLSPLPDSNGTWDVFVDDAIPSRGQPQLSASAYTITEGNTTIPITIERVGGYDGIMSVDLTTSDATATSGSDYTAMTQTLTFMQGEGSKTVYVPIIDDILSEGDETFTVTLSNPQPADVTLGSPSVATVTIQDNDELPAIFADDAAIVEGNSSTSDMTFTVRMPAAAGRDVTVDYATASISAQSGIDYTATSGTLTFAAGETSKTVTVPIVGDTNPESDETFDLVLSSATNAIIGKSQGVGTIVDDDTDNSRVGISIGDVSLTEGNSGSANANFSVSLSASSTVTTTVNYATAAATADSSDFTATSGTLTFAPGETSKTISVSVLGDTTEEPNEIYFVNLSSASSGYILDGQGVGLIVNDDTTPVVPSVWVSDAVANEGDTGTTNAAFTVTLSAATTNTVTVNLSTASMTATSPADFTAASVVLTFAPGETSKSFNVAVAGDYAYEGNEIFAVNVTGTTNATVGDGQGIGTILDNDAAAPTLSISDANVTEGNSGTATATFTVTLSSASTQAVAVDWATADGSASSASDYASANGTLTFAAGETTKTVSVTVNGDTDNEPNEMFFVNLSNASNATILDNQAIGNIVNDDDPMPNAYIDDVNVVEGNSGTSVATFTVTLSHASAQQVTVAYSTADVTAIAGSDYEASSGTLTFAAGETSKSIAVTIDGDTIDETNEMFVVNLSNATGAMISDNQATCVIDDDDDPIPTSYVSINDVSITEGNAGTSTATFNVTMSPASAQTVTVGFATADATATAGSDYVANAGSVSFAPGETSKTISVTINGDTTIEQSELYFVNLTSAAGATISDNQGVGVISDDDAGQTPSMSINDVTVVEGNTNFTMASFTVSLSSPASSAVSVNYATVAQSATGVLRPEGGNVPAPAAADFQLTSGTLTIPAGSLSASVNVVVLGDLLDEQDETFAVNLSSAVNATINDGQGIGTIVDNDAEPSLSVTAVSAVEGDSGTVPAGFVVTLSAPSGKSISFDYATSDGTASAGTDYTETSGNATLAPGTTSITINVPVIGDTTDESDEAFSFALSNPVNASIDTTSAEGTIVDDDGAAILVTPTAGLVTTEAGGEGTFSVVLTSEPTVDVTIDLDSSDATEGTVSATQLVFTAADWNVAQTVTVTGVDDADVDGDIPYAVVFAPAVSADANYNGLAGATVTVTNVDDELAPVIDSITPDNDNAGGGASFTITGSNFVTGATVAIGGIAVADASVVDSATITGTAPALPAAGVLYDVVVTNPNMQSGTKSGAFLADFTDVPQGSGLHDFVERLVRHGVTSGCGAGNFCPSMSISNAQMAVFLLRGKHGSSYMPPAATGNVFVDVPANSFAASWIEQLFREGITTGCGNNSYCPTANVTRGSMASLLLRGLYGDDYVPPIATGLFADVPASSALAPWVEQLYNEGITAGCNVNPLQYCPANPNTRGQMAVFITTTFDLQ